MSKKRFFYVFVTVLTICTMLSSNVAYAATEKVLTLKNKTLTMYVGESKTLGISKNTTGSKLSFQSSKKTIATVTSKGVISAKKAGKATITVKAGSKTAKCTVTVKNRELILKYTTKQLYVGDKLTLAIKTNTTGETATYKSSNTSVVTVSKTGSLSAKKKGTATITVKAGSKSATCKITVVSKVIEVSMLNFKEGSFTCIDLDHTYDNPVIVSPSNAADKSVKYSSSDTSILTVDPDTGAITGHKKGTAYVTATASNGVKAMCEVEVSSDSYYDSTEYLNSQNQDLVEKDSTLKVKQGDISLGMSVDELQSEIGTANRIEDNEYGGKTYVYNSDYSSLLFIYVEDDEVVGYFTNAVTFSSAGVSNDMTPEMVHEISNNTDMWTVTDKYTISVLYDSLGTGRPMALFVTKPSFDQEWGAEEYLQNPGAKLIDTMEMEILGKH